MYQRFLLSTLILFAATAVSAEVYSWKDAQGRMHYSDQPPPDVDARAVKPARAQAPVATQSPAADQSGVPAASASGNASAAPKTWEDKEREARERRAKQAEAEAKQAKEKERADEKQRYCTELRRNQTLYDRGGRIGRPNDKGVVELLSDSQIKAESERMREQIARDCGS